MDIKMFINLLPHDVVVMPTSMSRRMIFPKQNAYARVKVLSQTIGVINGVQIFKEKFGPVFMSDKSEFPDPRDGVYIIVSRFVRDALPHRKDLVCPSGKLRTSKGKLIGVIGFSVRWD